ncbi:aliphatic sulfonate ABC transporter substrate-binding protein [Clostridiales bacterium COT073_COT-073]|nr:aliphatic sulfonate ABC transporter substrate-binding protein [Clostridiales bacterium COT073_COT-073]
MKKIFSLILAMILVVSVAGCGNTTKQEETKAETKKEETKQEEPKKEEPKKEEPKQEEPKKEEPKEMTKVRVAYMPNMGSASSLIAARDYGFFAEQGIEVVLTKFSGGPAEIAAMASGDIDISQIGHGAHKLCIQGQAVIFQMEASSLSDEVIGNVERGVKTVADLKGKKVASTAGTSADIILTLALESVGLTKDDVEIIEMDANGVVPAMVSGKIDACATWSPGTKTILKEMGDKALTLANNADYVDKATFQSSFITTEKYAKSNEDVLVRFAAAIQKAQETRLDNLEEVAKMVAKETEISEEVMLGTIGESNWATAGTSFMKKALADGTVKKFYENQQRIFLNAGAIEKEVPVENYVLFDIMQKAYDLNNK